MQILSNPISALNVSESLKFSRIKETRGRGTQARGKIFRIGGKGVEWPKATRGVGYGERKFLIFMAENNAISCILTAIFAASYAAYLSRDLKFLAV